MNQIGVGPFPHRIFEIDDRAVAHKAMAPPIGRNQNYRLLNGGLQMIAWINWIVSHFFSG
jgi:hypothetical protein